MSIPTTGTTPVARRQKRMGPAPFASFEDLSDEVRSRLESPEEKNAAGSVVRLPGIREDATPTPSTPAAPLQQPEFVYTGISLVGAVTLSPNNMSATRKDPSPTTVTARLLTLQTPSTPRIDISRASSSSHHDSRDSTPERELFEAHDPSTAKLGLGFREEGALDLRSSTEELDFQDHQEQVKKKGKIRPQSPSLLHDDIITASTHQRKDSQSSELGFLCISGRTSRLSSIGSQGSAQSRLSNASHLSVISGQSGLSRSPSPHKMLLETSFCGTKPPDSKKAPAATSLQQQSNANGTKNVDSAAGAAPDEDMEKVLLARKQDPTQAVLAEGISVTKKPPEKPARKIEKRSVQSVKSDITIRVDEATEEQQASGEEPKLPKKIVSKSGVEYIYIPLKGPLPAEDSSESKHRVVRESKSATVQSKTPKPPAITLPKSATPSPRAHKKDEPKYIRIKLKPDYMYSQEDGDEKPSDSQQQKPDTLELNHDAIITLPPKEESFTRTEPGKSLTSTPSASPKLPRQTFLKDAAGSNVAGSKTPSPSLSRRSSFASLFRSKETIMSPESPTVPSGCRRKNTLTGMLRDAGDNLRDRSRSRSKSRERSCHSTAPSSTESIDSKSSKQKSVFSIFKPKKSIDGGQMKRQDNGGPPTVDMLPSIDGIAKVEFKFNEASNKLKYYETPLKGESIRIPLHSPSDDNDHILMMQDIKTSSQDSQDTVIEVCRNVEAIVEKIPQDVVEISNNSDSCQTTATVVTSVAPIAATTDCHDFNNKRQSSTSSENVVFSTKLGSNNEIFSTKLPKKKLAQQSTDEEKPQTNGHHEETADVVIERVPSTVVDTPTTTTAASVTTSTSTLSKDQSNRNSTISNDDERERCSSESERDSEADFKSTASTSAKNDLKLDLDQVEPERKGLVLQDSYEDELPYIPTTLPLERSAAVPIVPVKQRSTFEMKTCPIERPRSTTPINPSCLEDYCEEVMGGINTENITKQIEKLKISLPRHDSVEKSIKSPRKPVSNTNWFEFAEKGISGRRSSLTQEGAAEQVTPPPLPPKGMQKEWINFEEIPERRKPAKRIQTLPSRGHIDVPDSVLQDNVVYNYVNPEECKCECHEQMARKEKMPEPSQPQEDELPLLEDEPVDDEKIDRIKLDAAVADRRSIVSDSSVDLSASVEAPNGGVDLSLRTPFNSDLGVSSNRSSVVSQDESQSPESGSPNAFPKTF